MGKSICLRGCLHTMIARPLASFRTCTTNHPRYCCWAWEDARSPVATSLIKALAHLLQSMSNNSFSRRVPESLLSHQFQLAKGGKDLHFCSTFREFNFFPQISLWKWHCREQTYRFKSFFHWPQWVQFYFRRESWYRDSSPKMNKVERALLRRLWMRRRDLFENRAFPLEIPAQKKDGKSALLQWQAKQWRNKKGMRKFIIPGYQDNRAHGLLISVSAVAASFARCMHGTWSNAPHDEVQVVVEFVVRAQ